MRTKNSEWPRIREREPQSENSSWQVDCGKISGHRHRGDVPDKKAAEEYAAEIREQYAKEGELAFSTPIELRLEAERCAKQLALYGGTLTAAVEYYIEHDLKRRVSPVIVVMTEQLLEEKVKAGRRERTIDSLKWFFELVNSRYGK